MKFFLINAKFDFPLPPPEGDRTHISPSGRGQNTLIPLRRGQGEVLCPL